MVWGSAAEAAAADVQHAATQPVSSGPQKIEAGLHHRRGSPSPNGYRASYERRSFADMARPVPVGPGAMTFTRTPSASTCALRPMASPFMPALAAL